MNNNKLQLKNLKYIQNHVKNKYYNEWNFYYKKSINRLINNKTCSINILYKDLNIFDEEGEILRRYYTIEESDLRMINYVKSYTEIEYELLPNPSKLKLNKLILKREFKIYKFKNRLLNDDEDSDKKKKKNFNIWKKLKNSEYLIDLEVSSLLLVKKKKKSKNLSNIIYKELSDQINTYSNSIHDIYNPKIKNNLNNSLSQYSINSGNTISNSFLLNVSNITLRHKYNKNNKNNIKLFLNSEMESIKDELDIKLKKTQIKKLDKNKESNTIFKGKNINIFKNKAHNFDLKNTNSNVSYDKDSNVIFNFKKKKSTKVIKNKKEKKIKSKKVIGNNLKGKLLKSKSSKFSINNTAKNYNTDRKKIKILKNIKQFKNIFFNGTTPQNKVAIVKDMPKLIDFYFKSFSKNERQLKAIKTPNKFNKLYSSKKSFSFKNLNKNIIISNAKTSKNKKIKPKCEKQNLIKQNLIVSSSLPNFKNSKKIKCKSRKKFN